MTNKGKVLAAVVAVAVVLAGGVGLYLKGGDLMGKLGLSGNLKPSTSVTLPGSPDLEVPVSPTCVPGALVYDSDSNDGVFKNFKDFVGAVNNKTLNNCNYYFQGGQSNVDSFLAKCSKSDLYAFLATNQNPATISCSKKVGSDFLRFDLYQHNAVVNFHMDEMDSDTFGISTYKAYEPFEVRVQ